MQKYVPEADDKKGSLELMLEVVLQLVAMFIGIYFTDRIITYVPTYSGIKYLEFSVTNIILAVLIITLSLQTKLGEKVSILVDRVLELWNGPSDEKNKKVGKSHPQHGAIAPPNANANVNPNLIGMRDMGAGMNSLLPSTQMPPMPQMQQGMNMPNVGKQQLPDYNNMYANQSNPLINANTPTINQYTIYDGPIAANESVGGMFGTSF